MPKQTPQNPRFNDEGGIDFEIEFEGATHKASITTEGLESAYFAKKGLFAKDKKAMLRAVSESSYIADRIVMKLREGANPFLSSLDFLSK